jgi:hypothetical protein
LTVQNQLAALPLPWDKPYTVELRLVGLPPGKYNLSINGRPPREVDAADLVRYPLIVE